MDDDRAYKSRQRAMWRQGHYHRFATASLWGLGPLLVAACGISRGQRVLDVAAGTGNVAIRAAEAGAVVVASDLTPENFDAGRREASSRGVTIEWVEADVEALPFGDAEFDVVTSSVGVIFAPHPEQAADELLRVCRPGGTIGLVTIVPDRRLLRLAEIVRHHRATEFVPFAEGSLLRWGDEAQVRELFGDRVSSLSFERHVLEPSPLADLVRLKADHPVVVSLYRGLAAEPEQVAVLDRELAELAGTLRGARQELLVVVAVRAA